MTYGDLLLAITVGLCCLLPFVVIFGGSKK